ncbi:MAG TPA: CvpA family protein [Terracidiphilus sp.]|nr:CvpA family protein [Terracidiphilus sp.]
MNETIQTLTTVDWIIIAVIAVAVLGGLIQGFLRSVFALGGLVLGLALAAWNYGRAAALLMRLVHNEKLADAIGFISIAVLVMLIAGLTGSILSRIVQKIGLGCLDRLAGAVFGFFQGVVLVTLGILVTIAFFPQAQWLTESRLPHYFFGACHLSTNVTPDSLAQRVRIELNHLEQVSPSWMHPGKNGA